jgi:hypothetical protein
VPQLLEYIEKRYWKTIPSYPEYEASVAGHVRRKRDKRVLKQTTDLRGYLYVGMKPAVRRRHKINGVTVHHAVCEAFHGIPPAGRYQAAHWDGNKKNNKPYNLRWTSAAENSADRIRHQQEKNLATLND